MRLTQLLLVSALTQSAVAQNSVSDTTKFIGVLEYGSFLFKTPNEYTGGKHRPIAGGRKIAIYSYLKINDRVNPEWFRAVFLGDTGYVRQPSVKLPSEAFAYLAARGDIGVNERLPTALTLDIELEKENDDLLEKGKLAAKAEELEYKKREEEEDERLRKILLKGLAILKPTFLENKYSVDFLITIYNSAGKTIKYTWVTVTAYNPVHDIIETKTVQMVGPVSSGSPGRYQFENIFFTQVFKYGVVTKVKVQYMDGSIKEYSGKLLKEITL